MRCIRSSSNGSESDTARSCSCGLIGFSLVRAESASRACVLANCAIGASLRAERLLMLPSNAGGMSTRHEDERNSDSASDDLVDLDLVSSAQLDTELCRDLHEMVIDSAVYMQHVNDLLPSAWTIVSLTLSSSRDALILSRVRANRPALTVRLNTPSALRDLSNLQSTVEEAEAMIKGNSLESTASWTKQGMSVCVRCPLLPAQFTISVLSLHSSVGAVAFVLWAVAAVDYLPTRLPICVTEG
jgi:hypothetical protein